MAAGYKRLTRKARHIIRHLPRIKHASVQDQAVHELRHEVSRTHGFKGPGKAPGRSEAGQWRPLSRKAKHLLTRLRKAKVWGMQKRLVNELAEEIKRGRSIERVRSVARAAAARTRRAGGRFRETVNRGQERLLTRAERKQAEREKRGPREMPAAVRRSRQRYAGPFSSARAHRRWGRSVARREVPGSWLSRVRAMHRRPVRRAPGMPRPAPVLSRPEREGPVRIPVRERRPAPRPRPARTR